MSALAKVVLALMAMLLIAPLAYALSSVPTQTEGAVSADAGLPALPDMSMRPTASLAR